LTPRPPKRINKQNNNNNNNNNKKQGAEKEHAAEKAGCRKRAGEVGRSKELISE
jgi:hypothetical protein